MSVSSGKRIGVLTFHRCINYGSYWQARSLVEGLRARGHDAELMDHDSRRVNWAEARCAFQPLLPERTAAADFPLYAAKTRKFLAAFAQLPMSPSFPLEEPGVLPRYDLVVVGSDEVWNQRHPWYGGQATFYGVKVNADHLASYAASFGNHNADEGLDGWWADQLRGFSAISVRDRNSWTIVRDATGIDADMVLDPCLQFPPATTVASGEAPGSYVAVYGHSFPTWFKGAVRDWAAARGVRLLSIGYRNAWIDDHRIDVGPEEFAALIRDASAVVTNFFHGCVFALINDKPLACASSPYRSNKVRDLLGGLDAGRHLIEETAGGDVYAAALDRPLDHAIARRIEEMRQQSSRYLDRILG